MPEIDIIQNSVVRFIKANRNSAGMGFCINSGHLVTCAHVISGIIGLNKNKEQPDDNTIIQFEFPVNSNKIYKAKVVKWFPYKDDYTKGPGDIALLKIMDPIPQNLTECKLSIPSTDQVSFKARGFEGTKDSIANGLFYTNNLVAGGRIQLEKSSDYQKFIQPGFSGTPVVDKNHTQAYGMIVACDNTVAHMITAQEISDTLNIESPETKPGGEPDPDIKSLVLKQISNLFNKENMKIFKERIMEDFTEQNIIILSENNIPEKMIDLGTIDGIASINRSYKKLSNYVDKNKLTELWKDTKKIACWLVLLSVEGNWLDNNRNILEDQKEIKLAVEKDESVEIVVKCLLKQETSFHMEKKTIIPDYLIGNNLLESGDIKAENQLWEIRKEIFKAVCKDDLPNDFLDRYESYKEDIISSLKMYLSDKTPRFMILKSFITDQNINIILNEFKHLFFFRLSSNNDEKVFIMPESDISARMRIFLESKP